MIRTSIVRSTGQGETMTVDVAQWNPVTGEVMHTVQEMQDLAIDMLQLSDIRLHEMNMRMLNTYNFERYFEPGVWQMIVSMLDVLAGRVHPEEIIRRWDSIKEENADLERMRVEHFMRQQQESLSHNRAPSVPPEGWTPGENTGVVASCGCKAYMSGAVELCEAHTRDPHQ